MKEIVRCGLYTSQQVWGIYWNNPNVLKALNKNSSQMGVKDEGLFNGVTVCPSACLYETTNVIISEIGRRIRDIGTATKKRI